MRLFFALLIALVAGTCHGEDVREFSSKIPYFYLHPTAEDFSNFQKTANSFENGFKSANPGSIILLALMTAKISEKYGWPIQNTFFSSQAKEILEGKSELAKFIANDDAVNPSKLDVWWASFFATGDEKYLLSLLKYAGEEPPKGDVAKTMMQRQ
jgi:hypothetical protein